MPSGSTSADPRASSFAARSAASLPSSGRNVPTHSTRSAQTLSARYSSSASVSRSAQCRSSSTSRHPRSGDSTRSSRSTASPTKTSEPLSAASRPACHCGTSRPSAGRNGSSSALAGSPPGRSADASASANGRNGVGTPPATARPVSTAHPRAPAMLAHSRASRDFPIPASPASSTVPPRPASASARAARRRLASSSRPTSTGHSTGRTSQV